MSSIQVLLTNSLSKLKEIQDQENTIVIKSDQLSRLNLKRLVDNNFLLPIIKGWYMISNPNVKTRDTTIWYSSYWQFISKYSNNRYKQDWCLSAEQSIFIYSKSTIVPKQIIIKSTKGNNTPISLPNSSSILSLKTKLPKNVNRSNKYRLNLYPLAEAIITCSPSMYTDEALTMRTVLAMINNIDDILKILVDTGMTVRAGRVAGAFRNIGREKFANSIITTMKNIGYDIREEDPFSEIHKIKISSSPEATRIRLMWENMRDEVIKNFHRPKTNLSPNKFLEHMEAQYKLDAYHSLSIEGYRVTDEIIEKVKDGKWLPNTKDADTKTALAALGYSKAFQEVKNSVRDVLVNRKDISLVIKNDLSNWYTELFTPCVKVGIIKPSDIIGFRSTQVYISNSMHIPLNSEDILDAMSTLLDLIGEESNIGVRAVLGHFIFTFIHPYMDGNGRIGRFLMNVLLSSGGYDWLIIPVERREEYMSSLEKTSVQKDIVPFAKFLSSIKS
ncbi:MAG: Fic family protein [Bacteroidales bacterium]